MPWKYVTDESQPPSPTGEETQRWMASWPARTTFFGDPGMRTEQYIWREPCPNCRGKGHILMVFKPRSLGITTLLRDAGTKVKCPDCNGTGDQR